MDKRDFYVFITPITGGADREIVERAINFGEAEALAAKYIEDGEFISRIEQDFPGDDDETSTAS